MSQRSANLIVFTLLVAIAVVGRWGQPEWAFTPMAAVGLLAGYWFRSPWIAALAPMTAMAASDLALASYDSALVQATVYGALGASALLGRVLRRPIDGTATALTRLGFCVVAPSALFFITTNFAVWISSGRYAKTVAGLAECYTAALPFYRQMLAGDVLYAAVLLTAAAAAGVFSIYGHTGKNAAVSAA